MLSARNESWLPSTKVELANSIAAIFDLSPQRSEMKSLRPAPKSVQFLMKLIAAMIHGYFASYLRRCWQFIDMRDFGKLLAGS